MIFNASLCELDMFDNQEKFFVDYRTDVFILQSITVADVFSGTKICCQMTVVIFNLHTVYVHHIL